MQANTCHLEWCDGEVHDANDCTFPHGGWHCVTCHNSPNNNWMANTHTDTNPGHVIGWSCGEHLVIEQTE